MKYDIRLKQGSRTLVNRIEFKTQQHLLDFFNTITTTQVTRILGENYIDDTLPPIDDMAYFPLGKFYIHNDTTGKTRQIILHNIKLTKSTDEIIQKIKECMEIDNLPVTSVRSGLLKAPMS